MGKMTTTHKPIKDQTPSTHRVDTCKIMYLKLLVYMGKDGPCINPHLNDSVSYYTQAKIVYNGLSKGVTKVVISEVVVTYVRRKL